MSGLVSEAVLYGDSKSSPASLLYARGFLLTEDDHDVPVVGWQKEVVGGWTLSFDPVTPVARYESDGIFVTVLGHAIHPHKSGDQDIARPLVRCIRRGLDRFQDTLDEVVGRFLVIYGRHSELMAVQQDATGMRSVFFLKDAGVIGSHAHLVASQGRRGHVSVVRKTRLPGRLTPYEGVKHLTPNTELEVNGMTTRRIFPRAQLKELSVEKASEHISDLVRRQLPSLTQMGDLALSLSSGIDSRTTLACVQPIVDQILCFTYAPKPGVHIRNPQLSTDREVASEIAETLKLRHRLLEIDTGRELGPEISDALRRNSYTSHSAELALEYLDHLSNVVHLRSNILGLGKAAYRSVRPRRLPLTVERMSRMHLRRSPKDDAQAVRLGFQEFVDATNFAIDGYEGYDPYDLFYWEYRMGTWHANLLLESDLAHDTMVLFNSREILSAFMAVPLEDRYQSRVHNGIIEQNWPVLRFWPVNATRHSPVDADSEFDQALVDMRRGTVDVENWQGGPEPDATVRWSGPSKLAFWLARSDPQAGDSVRYSIALPCEIGRGYTLAVEVWSPYSSTSGRGKISYLVKFGEREIFNEDVAETDESRHVRIWWSAESPEARLSVEVRAEVDCPSHGWGRAGRVLVRDLAMKETNHDGPVQWKVTPLLRI